MNATLPILSGLLLPGIAAVCSASPAAASHRGRPNVILIYADDLGYGDLGCYGHPTMQTPNIDALAEGGVRLTSFYSPASVSSPARAGLLTGRYPVRSGMYGDRVSVLFPDTPRGLPEEEITLAEMFRDSGYDTAVIGKWHQGHAHPYMPSDHGFGYFFGVLSPHNYRTLPLMENDDVLHLHADINNLTKMYTDKACDYIRKHRKTPFFLYMPHSAPHLPVVSSPEFAGKSLAGKYGDMVEEMDWSVGEVLRTLRENGLEDNTIVIFTSDNGPSITNTPLNGGSAGILNGGKFSPWEGGFRIPGIIRYPKRIKAGGICREMASQLDILPTLAAYCSLPLQAGVKLDGYDLSGMLSEGGKTPRKEFAYYMGSRLAALRVGRFKAIYSEDGSSFELYNVNIDPGETRDLLGKHPELVEMFLKKYKDYKSRIIPAPSINDERPEGSNYTGIFRHASPLLLPHDDTWREGTETAQPALYVVADTHGFPEDRAEAVI